MNRPFPNYCRAAATALLLSMGAARAGDLQYQATLGGGYTDNITRASADGADETIASAGLKLSFDEQGKRVDADIVSDLAYYDYLDGTYDSELVGNIVGKSRVALVEDRLSWTMHDNFGQVLSDPFQPSTPANREDVNYLDTGLDATFAFGSQTRLNVGGSYALASYERTPLDSGTVVADVALNRISSEATSMGVHLRRASVSYDDDSLASNDYDQDEAFAEYAIHGSRTVLDAALGYTRLDREVGESDSGMLFRLNLGRRISTMSWLDFSAGQEFSNSASAFAAGQGGSAGLETAAGRQTSAPFTYQHAELSWRITGHRTAIEASGGWRRDKYSNQSGLDQELSSLRLRLSRDLTSALELTVEGGYEREQFAQFDDAFADLVGSLSLRWRLTRRLVLSLDYDYSHRNEASFASGYSENRFWLTLGYERGVPRDAMRSPYSGDGT